MTSAAGDPPPAREGLILASASPQRRAILRQLGVRFTAVDPRVEELTTGDPELLVVENARRKARAVEGARVLGADTAVVLDGRVLGKPSDEAEARDFLAALSGRDHRVLTGVAARDGERERTGVGEARVRFRSFERAEEEAYLATGEWRGRAGAYAIQGRGAVLVEEIEGDYNAVVGLPVAAIVRMAPDFLHPSEA